MTDLLVYPIGSTPACTFAAQILKQQEIPLVDHPTPEVTHLLLDVPSFGPDGLLRGGGDIREVLQMLTPGITVVGGNLAHPALESYQVMDLLKNEAYLAINAAITAECALQVAAPKLRLVFAACPVLILGWGRIGKCLGKLLKAVGAGVTIAARKESDRAMLRALGFEAVDIRKIRQILPEQRVVFNTVPELLLHKEDTSNQRCLFVDLASKAGMEGEQVVLARGLPGIYAPESSGKLIAETFVKITGRDLE